MDDHSRSGSAPSSTPDLDASQSTALNRCAEGEDGRIAGVTSLKVSQKLEVICIWVVCGEPRLRWNYNVSVHSPFRGEIDVPA